MIKNRKAFIVGISTTYLKKKEITFIKKNKPWGIILFTRNIKNLSQTKKLVTQIKNCFKDIHYPILIDEEGGRVSRLKNIIETKKYTSKYFGNLYLKNKEKFYYEFEKYINFISGKLNLLGININTVPVLDVIRKKTNRIIGDRSFSNNPKIVSKIGDLCIKIYDKNKIATVLKHIPGHGLAKSDSHLKTPIISSSKATLNNIDFLPFKNKKTFFAMTAHIILKNYDSVNTVTHSKAVIDQIIRKKLKFKNILISDDISMKALKHNLKKNVIKSIKSGCNLVLHCNANMKEMRIVARNVKKIDDFTFKKTSQFYKFLM